MANLMAKCECGKIRTWCRGGSDPGCNCKLFKDPKFDEAIKAAVHEKIEEVKVKKRRRNWEDIPIDDEVGEIIPVEENDAELDE
jgi:hypothetical protein